MRGQNLMPCFQRKKTNRTQKRNSKNTSFYKGFYINDYIKVFNQKGYISGFASG